MNRKKQSALLLTALTILGLVVFAEHFALAQGTRETDSNQNLTPLPEPPQQHLPWTQPLAGFAPGLLKDITKFFDLGVADPRGCDYRQIEIFFGTWPNRPTTRVHGWVMPESLASMKRYAVGWDGLVHPVVSIGPQAQLSADVEYLLLARDDLNKKILASTTGWDVSEATFRTDPELYSLSETNPTDIKVALLLRLGETDLARQYWERQNAVSKTRKHLLNNDDPFFALTYNWAAVAFDRAVAMHLVGNDSISLSDCVLLSRASPVITGILDQHVQATLLRWEKNRPYFGFLNKLPELLADEQRRVENVRNRVGTLQITSDQTPEQIKLEGLILDLENAALKYERSSWWGEDTAFNSIVAQGESAVEPLLQCLEQDERLTRSVYTRQ
ncbi:MAG: putative lipoprotein [Verrucomicrobiales bacterium]|nr:putative lipoprotein [Verrucomicrobiales bacterium]